MNSKNNAIYLDNNAMILNMKKINYNLKSHNQKRILKNYKVT